MEWTADASLAFGNFDSFEPKSVLWYGGYEQIPYFKLNKLYFHALGVFSKSKSEKTKQLSIGPKRFLPRVSFGKAKAKV